MAQNDIGIDLGTTTIIIAQEGQGVVLNQPSVVAVDTRKNCVLEAGDKALAMVGRTPNYISAIFPLKDGVISDHTMTRELICRFVNQVYSSHMVKPRVAVCVPAAITGIESDAVVEAVMAAGARQVYLIDEPIAAALGSGIDITVPELLLMLHRLISHDSRISSWVWVDTHLAQCLKTLSANDFLFA